MSTPTRNPGLDGLLNFIRARLVDLDREPDEYGAVEDCECEDCMELRNPTGGSDG